MIYGIGIDIIEVSRVEKQVARSDERFARRIFTQREIAYCEKKRFKAQNYAARFAAKEAFLKALGTGLSAGLTWKEVEVMNDEKGKPCIEVSGKVKEFIERTGITGIQVSLAHLKDTAVAVVIIEK